MAKTKTGYLVKQGEATTTFYHVGGGTLLVFGTHEVQKLKVDLHHKKSLEEIGSTLADGLYRVRAGLGLGRGGEVLVVEIVKPLDMEKEIKRLEKVLQTNIKSGGRGRGEFTVNGIGGSEYARRGEAAGANKRMGLQKCYNAILATRGVDSLNENWFDSWRDYIKG